MGFAKHTPLATQLSWKIWLYALSHRTDGLGQLKSLIIEITFIYPFSNNNHVNPFTCN